MLLCCQAAALSSLLPLAAQACRSANCPSSARSQDKGKVIDKSKHHVLTAAHPSGLSANRGFFGCRHFSQTNRLLEKDGQLPIDWCIE